MISADLLFWLLAALLALVLIGAAAWFVLSWLARSD
jgi:hypothetical protein